MSTGTVDAGSEEALRRLELLRRAKELDPGMLTDLQAAADAVFVHDAVVDYAVRLVLATREPAAHGLADLTGLIAHGASPRATLGLVAAAKIRVLPGAADAGLFHRVPARLHPVAVA